MLERLTDRTGNGQVYLIEGPEEDMYGYYTGKGLKQIEKVIARLAAYEDSGLSPEQVQGFAKAEREGRLVVLPCKVGDTVYYLTGRNVAGGNHADFDKVKESNVQGFYMNGDSLLIQLRYWVGNHGTYGAFGKTVFLTREAAEKTIVEAKRAAEEAFAEAFCDFAESHANREFERQMREGWEG